MDVYLLSTERALLLPAGAGYVVFPEPVYLTFSSTSHSASILSTLKYATFDTLLFWCLLLPVAAAACCYWLPAGAGSDADGTTAWLPAGAPLSADAAC